MLVRGLAELLAPSSCLRCGRRGAPAWCRPCRSELAPLRWDGQLRVEGVGLVEAVMRYQADAASLVVRGKLAGQHAVWGVIGTWFRLPRPADVVVPVPTDPARRRRRGFDHTARLAAGVARRHRLDVLAAVRAPRGSADRGRGERDGPARDWRLRRRLDGARVLVVDDVVTTGATLAEVAEVCRRGGAARVDASVFAATPRPDRFPSPVGGSGDVVASSP